MTIKETIQNTLNKILPGNRSDSQNLLYNRFINQYQWVNNTGKQNKQYGNYQVYYQAGKNTYVTACINAYYAQLLTNGFTIKNPKLESINKYHVNYIEGLFNSPEGINSDIRYAQFLRQIVNSYLLIGDAFVEISYDDLFDNKIVNGFKFIPPELIRWYDDTEQYGFVNNSSLRFEPNDLIHIYDPPIRTDNKFGDSRIDTIGLALSLLFESLKYNKDFFKSGGIDPNSIISFDKEMTNTEFMNEVERLSIQAKQNRRGTLAVKGGSIQSINHNLQDADFSNLILLSRNIILNGFNVPPSLAGIVETANLSANTIDSEMRVFKPFVNALGETIEGAFNQVLGRNGFSEVFEFNPIDLTDKLEEMTIRKMELETGLKTVNEIRVEMGLGVVPWGDSPLGSTGDSVPEVSTGDAELDEAFDLIRQAESSIYEQYTYPYGYTILNEVE